MQDPPTKEAERALAAKQMLGCFPWILAGVCAAALFGAYSVRSLEVGLQRRQARQFIKWLGKLESEKAGQSEVRRYFDEPSQEPDQDLFHYSPRPGDTWGILITYKAGRVDTIRIDGKTAAETEAIYPENK